MDLVSESIAWSELIQSMIREWGIELKAFLKSMNAQ